MLLQAWPFNDARAALDLDFRTGRIDPRLTCSGGANGTVFDSTGTLVSATCPRFDYHPTSLRCLGLLVEEQRTNVLLRSEEFDNASWTKTRSSITANATTSPAGTTTADKLVEDTTATNTHLTVQNVTTTAAAWTVSVYAKAAERSWIRLILFDGSLSYAAFFNLAAGTVGTTTNSPTTSITSVGNSWYRCVVTATTAAGAGNVAVRMATADNTDTYTGDGTSGVHLWGIQAEAGAFATSYIPTTSAAVTRTADSVSMTGDAFAQWYSQTGGTIAVESQRVGAGTTAFPRVMQISDGTNNNSVNILWSESVARLYFAVNTASVNVVDIGNNSLTPTAANRAAASFQTNNYKISNNSLAVQSDIAGAMPTVDRLIVGNDSGTSRLNGHISRLRYWRAAANDDTLRRLTLA